MTRLDATMGMGILLCAVAFAARGEAAYDNPSTSAGPCLVVSEFSVTPKEDTQTVAATASAKLENVCRRAVDVSFCFVYSSPTNEPRTNCFGGVVRPQGESVIRDVTLPTHTAEPDFRWRYFE